MTIKINLEKDGYSLYCLQRNQYVYSVNGEPSFSYVPKASGSAGSIEKVQGKKDRFLTKFRNNALEEDDKKVRSHFQHSSYLPRLVQYWTDQAKRVEAFVIVKIEVTVVK